LLIWEDAEAALVAVEGFEAKFPPRNDEAAAEAAVCAP
jgi:hypothetical protein